MVDFKAKPYNLDDESIKWVQDTIAGMTTEEKIGQLFFNMGSSRDESYLKDSVQKYHIGGVRYNPASSKEVYEQNRILQENAKIPLIIACNTEGGGNGACTDGTLLGMPVKIGATNSEKYAYEMGRIGNKEAAAIGCNMSFAPLSDINYNWRNPIIPSRCFSNDAKTVARMAKAYFDGAHENEGFSCAAKHFPGDGIDDRDQHLSASVNTFDCDKWMDTYGVVYKTLIDGGLEAIMAGHIMLPSWSQKLNPNLKDEDVMPATLSKELLYGLLRDKLGYNGMILTDASHMVGLTCMYKRSEMLPRAIEAGCDMFLFFNDMDEDFNYMLEGYKSGIITEKRLQEALERILGLKASKGMHKKAKTEIMPPLENVEKIVGCEEHKAMAKEIAQKSVTLVKNKQDIMPITPEKYKRIMIVPVKGADGGGIFGMMKAGAGPTPAEKLKAKLEERGFDVNIFVSPLDVLQADIQKEMQAAAMRGEEIDKKALMGKALMVYFAGKTPIKDFVEAQDLVITLANVNCAGQTAARVSWAMSKGGGEIPWYVHELPVIVASIDNPFVLADVPQAKTFINTYDTTDNSLNALVEKICGESEFEGIDPVDAFCGLFDTRM